MRRCLVPLIIALAATLLISCGGDDNNGNGSDGTSTPGRPTTITVWHSMPSLAQGVIQRLVDGFNESQTQYKVELIYQGSYTESLNKLISSLGAGNIPAIIQLSDVATQIMIDSAASDVIVPVQEFVDNESYDLADFEPKALQYYTIDGTLYAMPFNLAGPILYYDRKAFSDAGLDPDKPPRTLDELRQYSEQLAQRQGATRTGISLEVSSWTFEEMLAKSGALFANNGNGRDDRATEAVFAGPEGKAIIEWWASMVKDGLAYNTNDTVDAFLKLASGETSMAIASTAALRGAIAALAIAGKDVNQYDAAPMPGPESPNGGIALGGAAFWILKDRPEEERQGAWEFLKYASSPEAQARWHADTGYFPSRLSAYDQPPAQEAGQQFPQFQIAVQQLRDSPDNPATRGALIGPFNAVRDTVTRAFEQVLGGAAQPDEALEAAQVEANRLIEEYNRTAP